MNSYIAQASNSKDVGTKCRSSKHKYTVRERSINIA